MSDMLGMGITVSLRDMFSEPSTAIRRSSSLLSSDITKDAQKVNAAWKLMGVGASVALGGGAILGSLSMLGKVALEKSAELELLRTQLIALTNDAKVGKALYAQTVQAAVDMPYTIPQVMAATKTMLAYGVGVGQVGRELKMAGNWAAAFKLNIEESAIAIGKVRSGAFSQAYRLISARGISYADLMAAGAPIIKDKQGNMKKAPGADPMAMLEAINKVIEKKFPNMMDQLMATFEGMRSNVEDRLIVFAGAIGDRFRPYLKTLFGWFIQIFDPKVYAGFAAAIGDGLGILLKITTALLSPFAKLLIWAVELSKTHPEFVKWGVALAGITGSALVLASAILTLTGAYLMFKFAVKADAAKDLGKSFLKILPGIGWVAGAVALLAMVWKYNIFGVGDVLTRWYNNSKMVFGGLIELLSSLKNGVGTMSMETKNNLEKSGLLGVTIKLFMGLYRLYQVFMGVWDACSNFVAILVGLASAVMWVVEKVLSLVGWCLRLVGVMSNAGNNLSPEKWKTFGYILTWIIGLVYAYRAIMWTTRAVVMAFHSAQLGWAILAKVCGVLTNVIAAKMFLFSVAAKIATAAQWLWNVALTANPIGVIIMAIAVLIVAIILLVVYWKQIHAWIMKAPTWLLVLIAVINPMIGIPMLIIKYWSPIKNFFMMLGHAIKVAWNTTIDWLIDKFMSFSAWFMRMMVKVAKFIPSSMLPAEIRFLTKMNPDEIDGAYMKKAMSLGWDTAKQLVGISPAVAAINAGSATADAVNAQNKNDKTPIQVNSTIHLDGREVARSVTKHQQEAGADGR